MNFHTYQTSLESSWKESAVVMVAITFNSEREEAQLITLGQQLHNLCTAAILLSI